ncbi:hypothetical protein [Sediminicurvatus halobius]|uniref:hypothetical protein n=1 Tax=Sediminicurvatus halobius TaxID=2182432 RepID=UPI001304EE33|nr:hypothetical protein [Spiribacter halobius]UEX76839.1 hypothetical protein LMH63_12825 [Spiribacter halobius]
MRATLISTGEDVLVLLRGDLRCLCRLAPMAPWHRHRIEEIGYNRLRFPKGDD